MTTLVRPVGLGVQPRCRHCGNPRGNRPRQLCHHCYMDADVRYSYPPLRPCSPRAEEVDHYSARDVLPALPTDARPGTDQKIAVMQERALRRQSLHHPADQPLLPVEEY